MPESGTERLVAELAERTSVDSDTVRNILDELGLDAALACVSEAGIESSVNASHLKLAVKLGRNLVCV